ncbi:MAG: thiol protease/hemagglutinin PrtT [Bacteroidales bacterium]|nr:thiol protease/hemagglutinin PrtT [Bacteroidales bacterium]
MKKLFLTLGILLGCVFAYANPVSLEEASSLGQKFVNANFAQDRQSSELTLVYSTPSFYIFNVGNNGFVILSADDSYRPVIAYSNEGVFEPDNIAPALQEYLADIDSYRTSRGPVAASVEAAEDWAMLREYGKLMSRFGGREDDYLVETKWNQNYPYNYCCPVDADGPGGHVYAGCVATAAAQLMRYWCHPLQGTGSHTYTPEDNPQYGPLTVNFGATTYDWENMPNTISASSPTAQLEAVGTLIYHCGVAVDMNYRPSSSGAVTTKLCTVAPQYFSYTTAMANHKREDYSKEEYLQLLYDAIDMNWPMVHRGGGHAYVIDGYDDAGLVHINWGWSGSSDAYFDIDGHNYTDGQSVIYNFVPAAIYSATANTPTNLTVTVADNNELQATVAWNNPTVTLTNQALTAIDQIVVERNNEIVYVQENVTPGSAMSFVDTTIPCFDAYTYKVYAVIGGQRGKSAVRSQVVVGPTCEWKFIISSTNIQGWRGGYIGVYTGKGSLVTKVTVNNSTPAAINVDMPVGRIKLVWKASESSVTGYTIAINVKDSEGNSVYNYSGLNTGMEDGLFYSANNGCGNAAPASAPTDLYVTGTDNDIVLNWTGVREEGYGYNVYRDDVLIRLVYDTEFTDVAPSIGGHCYTVSFLGVGGESEYSNDACGNAGEGCDTGSHLWYEIQNNFKPILSWEAPEVSEGLSGYLVYRKMNDGQYERIKIVSANKTEYKENSALVADNWYYYKVIPYYQAIDCYAAPIKALYGNEYFVKIFYSTDNVDENLANEIGIYPNPTTGVFTVEAENISRVEVYNLIGQKVFSEEMFTSKTNIDMTGFDTGIYMVRIIANGTEITRKVSVIR